MKVLRYGRDATDARLRDFVAARFHTLTMPARAIVGCAALVGYRFDSGLLARCARVAPEVALEALRSAQHLDLIVWEPGWMQFRFRHDLTRTAIRHLLGLERRRELHAMIASALETVFDAQSRTEQLAHHWAAAGNTERAVMYAERAAQEARRLGLGS